MPDDIFFDLYCEQKLNNRGGVVFTPDCHAMVTETKSEEAKEGVESACSGCSGCSAYSHCPIVSSVFSIFAVILSFCAAKVDANLSLPFSRSVPQSLPTMSFVQPNI